MYAEIPASIIWSNLYVIHMQIIWTKMNVWMALEVTICWEKKTYTPASPLDEPHQRRHIWSVIEFTFVLCTSCADTTHTTVIPTLWSPYLRYILADHLPMSSLSINMHLAMSEFSCGAQTTIIFADFCPFFTPSGPHIYVRSCWMMPSLGLCLSSSTRIRHFVSDCRNTENHQFWREADIKQLCLDYSLSWTHQRKKKSDYSWYWPPASTMTW